MTDFLNSVPTRKTRRSRFRMNHEVKTSIGMGRLTPFLYREVMPGDKWNVVSDFLVRAQPMLSPIMHNVDIRTETYFVPFRLIWKDTEKFFTGGKNGTDEPVKPHVTRQGLLELYADDPKYFVKGSLWDYFALPIVNIENGQTLDDVLPADFDFLDLSLFIAYHLIYQEYYRDQNLTDEEFEFPFQSGEVTNVITLRKLFSLKNRCYEKDYFTACLPFTQRAPTVSIPVSGDTIGDVVLKDDTGMQGYWRDPNGDIIAGDTPPNLSAGPDGISQVKVSGGSITGAVYDPNGTLAFDGGTGNASITVEDLRRSTALQRLFEAMARGGARYIEMLLAVFGVVASDKRLQRPEYIGGGKSPITVSTVLQTSSGVIADLDTTPQGNLSGYGIGGGVNHGCHRYFEEHGFLISIMSVRPRTSYQMGIERIWTRKDRFAYPFPHLAHLGEQPVYTHELYSSNSLPMNKIFGYLPRYADWKFINSRVTGEFRDTLSYWDLTRKFANEPVLSQSFMEIDQYDASRIFAAGTQTENQQFLIHINVKVNLSRLLPKFGVPRL